jgi:hypothetical protein
MTQMLIDIEKEQLERAAKRGNRPIRLLEFRLPRLRLWFRPVAPKLQRNLK